MQFSMLLTALALFSGAPADTTAEGLIQAMHDRYAGKWPDRVTFVQTSTFYEPDGKTRAETWYEAIEGPDKLRIIEDAIIRPAGLGEIGETGGVSGLALDLFEREDQLVVTAGLPGVKPEDVDISIQGNFLTIQGQTKAESETTKGHFHRRERRVGQFYRQIQLPVAVKTEGAEARFENGVLTLELPKVEEARERKIPVRTGAASSGSKEIGGRSERR